MSSDLAIRIVHLSKEYNLGLSGRTRSIIAALKDRVRHPIRGNPKRERLQALDDVTFDVARGEVVGVIGKNGAGKSTLLKILSRVVAPTSGHVDIRGHVGSLLEVGTGFHPELTGLENVYLNGTILGMSKAQIDSRLDEIVDFADVRPFLDTPVKRYSSGMRVRLAFAVAAHLDAEILIVDEVLSVGDYSFQAKCVDKMRSITMDEGRTVLYVSHNLVTVQNLCARTVLMDHGRVVFDGDTDEAISHYLNLFPRGQRDTRPGEFDLSVADRTAIGVHAPVFQRIRLRPNCGPPSDAIPMGAHLRVEVDVHDLDPDAMVHIVVGSNASPRLFRLTCGMRPLTSVNGRSRSETIVADIPSLPLTPGDYYIELHAYGHTARLYDQVLRAAEFSVLPSDVLGNAYQFTSQDGLFVVPFDWEVRGPDDR